MPRDRDTPRKDPRQDDRVFDVPGVDEATRFIWLNTTLPASKMKALRMILSSLNTEKLSRTAKEKIASLLYAIYQTLKHDRDHEEETGHSHLPYTRADKDKWAEELRALIMDLDVGADESDF